jgi:CHAD domain-containing protein
MNSEHTREHGLRMHHLVNLGGLVAVAGLDHEPPDFLLGVLISAANECKALTKEQATQIAALGHKTLDERATQKRAWKSWKRQQDLHSFLLNSEQIRRVIEALGGTSPADPAQLVTKLTALLEGQKNVPAMEAAR